MSLLLTQESSPKAVDSLVVVTRQVVQHSQPGLKKYGNSYFTSKKPSKKFMEIFYVQNFLFGGELAIFQACLIKYIKEYKILNKRKEVLNSPQPYLNIGVKIGLLL